MTAMTEPLLKVREAARRLGVHENTIRNWCDEGRLAYVTLPGASGYRRIPESAVVALEEGRLWHASEMTTDFDAEQAAGNIERNAIATAETLRGGDLPESLQTTGWMLHYLGGVVGELVRKARDEGMNWAQIGAALNIPASEAREIYKVRTKA